MSYERTVLSEGRAASRCQAAKGPACSRLRTYGNGAGHDVADAEGHKIGELEAVYVDTGTDAPSIGTDAESSAGDEEAIFKHYGLAYQPAADRPRLLARR